MCPVCMTSIALIAAGGSSAGGMGMFALTRFRASKRRSINKSALKEKFPSGIESLKGDHHG